RDLHSERELVRLESRREFGVAIAGFQVLLVEAAKSREKVLLLVGGHAFGRREVEDRIAARAEGSALIDSRKEAVAIDAGAGAHAAFEQDHKAGKILVFGAEAVQDPGAQAGAPDPRPAVIDEELRLRVREALVVARPDNGEVVHTLRRVREQVGDFDP